MLTFRPVAFLHAAGQNFYPPFHQAAGGIVPLITFDTTHHALWAEELAREAGIAHEMVPAPPAANARCDLALEVLAEDIVRLTRLLESAEIPHASHP